MNDRTPDPTIEDDPAGLDIDALEDVATDLDPEFADDDLDPNIDALDEIEALAEAERTELAAARAEHEAEIETERERTRTALARYRDAVLAANPELPPELIRGATLEELEASIEVARTAVAEIRARIVEATPSPQRGFPVGAPARVGATSAGMTSSEKIRRGLSDRVRT